jgi:hypothetical protein
MRDLKRQVSSRINRATKAEERMLYGYSGTAKRKARKTVKSVPPKAEDSGHKDRDTGENAIAHD